jgi:hypothetical protein
VGVDLFMHSVRLVLGDWRNAVRITGALYLIYAIPALILGLLTPQPPADATPTEIAATVGAAAPLGLITVLLLAVVYVWLAVTWHRYILLNEEPTGQLPPFRRSEILAYAGNAILLALIMIALSIVVGLVLSPLLLLGVVGAIIMPIVFISLGLIVNYRLGLVLPSRAVGQRLTLGEAWAATKGQSGTILVLAIVSAIAAVVINIPALILAFIPGIGGILSSIWQIGTGWVTLLVGVSVLTTLYGVFVEKRSISN